MLYGIIAGLTLAAIIAALGFKFIIVSGFSGSIGDGVLHAWNGILRIALATGTVVMIIYAVMAGQVTGTAGGWGFHLGFIGSYLFGLTTYFVVRYQILKK